MGSTGLAVAPPVTADSEGGFAFQLPGNTAYSGLRVIAELGSEQRIGLAPEVTKQASVLDGIRTVPMNLVPAMENLNAASTTVALILLQRSGGTPLGSDVLSAAGSALEEGLDNVPAIQTVHSMVEALFAEQLSEPLPNLARFDWIGQERQENPR